MDNYIKNTLYRYNKKKGYLALFKTALFSPGLRFILLKKRIEHISKISPLFIVYKFWYKRIQVKYGFQIPYNTKIGYGLFMPHYGGIIINKDAIIGNNCNIAQGVTIGQTNRGAKKGCPTIGDRVWIGANAVITGNIQIGNDALIAPLSFVNFDIPEKAVVSGNPAKIISYNGSIGYVNNTI